MWRKREKFKRIKVMQVLFSEHNRNFFFSKTLFQVKDDCFTILHWFLPYINVKQPQANIRPLPLEPPCHPTPSRPSGLSQTPDLHSLRHAVNSHWPSISHVVGHMLLCYSRQSVPSSSHPVTTVGSLCLGLYCCPANRFTSTIFLESICVC